MKTQGENISQKKQEANKIKPEEYQLWQIVNEKDKAKKNLAMLEQNSLKNIQCDSQKNLQMKNIRRRYANKKVGEDKTYYVGKNNPKNIKYAPKKAQMKKIR
ncbi:hypothetical protein ABPG73_019549 [Tetrahymena malaccensis]